MDWLDNFNQKVQGVPQESQSIAPAQLQAETLKEPVIEDQGAAWLDTFDTQVQEAQTNLEVPQTTESGKPFEAWFDEKYSGTKEFLEASGESMVQLGYGAISFLPSYGVGFATMVNEKVKNLLRQDRIDETVRRGGFSEDLRPTDLARKPMTQQLEEAKIKSPKEIRALADKSTELFASVMDEPITPGGKKVIGKAGELMEWLFHYPKKADEKLSEAGYPNLGYLTGFAGEMLLLKGIHGAAKKGKAISKSTISRFIKTVEDVKSIKTPTELKAVDRQVNKILDQLGITEEQRMIATDKTFRGKADVGSWMEERARISKDVKLETTEPKIVTEEIPLSKDNIISELKPEAELSKPSVQKLNVEREYGKRVASEISDGIKVAEDMAVYETIRAGIESKKKVGKIMKEIKEDRYYEEDLKDFNYSEKDLRSAIRAIKVREFGDVKIGEEIKTKLAKETAKIKDMKIKKPEVTKVDIEKGRAPGVKADLKKYEQPSRVKEEIAELKIRREAEMAPLRTIKGKLVGSKVLAMRMAKSRGILGDVVRTPDGNGWYVKKTKEMKAKEVEATKKFWDSMLKEDGMGVIEPETGVIRSTVEALKSTKGVIDIDFTRLPARVKTLGDQIKQALNHMRSLAVAESRVRKGRVLIKEGDWRVFEEFAEELGAIAEGLPRGPLATKVLKLALKDFYLDTRTNISMQSRGINKALNDMRVLIKKADVDVPDIKSLEIIKGTPIVTFKEKLSATRLEGIMERFNSEPGYKGYTTVSMADLDGIYRSGSKVKVKGLPKESIRKVLSSGLKMLKSERGSIIISKEMVKKLHSSVKRRKVSEADLVAEMQRRKVPNSQILKVFPNAFKKTAVEGTSKWLGRRDLPEEFLARRIVKKKTGRMKYARLAPAVTRGDAHVVSTFIKDLPKAPIGDKIRLLATSEGIFTRLGKDIKETFYRPMTKAAKAESDFSTTLIKKNNKLKQQFAIGTRQKHAKRIELYAIAKQKDGLARLKSQGVKENQIPKELNTKEQLVYDTHQKIYKDLFKSINEARRATGQRLFPPVENYSPWFHDLAKIGEIEQLSILDNLGEINKAMTRLKEIPSQIDKISRAPGLRGHEKFRSGPDTPGYLTLNAFDNFAEYSKIASNAIHIGPTTAYLHELLRPKFNLAENAPNTWKFLSDWLDYQKGKEPIMFIENPVARRRIRELGSNIAVSYITYSFQSALNQMSSMNNTFTLLGTYNTARGIAKAMSPYQYARASRESNILTVRSPEVALIESGKSYPLIPGKTGRTVSDIWSKTRQIGSKPLMIADDFVAHASWLGAEAKAKRIFKTSETYKRLSESQRVKAIKKFSRDYADDVVERAQGSATRAARAPIQRTAEGAAVTTLQTFVIAQFDFISRHILGIRNPDITKLEQVARVTRYVLGTAAISYAFDLAGMRTPAPTPAKAFLEEKEKTKKYSKAMVAAGKELTEYLPVVGGRLKYGSELGGVLANEVLGLAQGDPTAIPRLLGIPGFNQLLKSLRASKHGGENVDIIFGRYVDNAKSKKQRIRR